MFLRSCHSLAQNPPGTSLSLTVKPELGFTFFRSVLKCLLNDKAFSNHPLPLYHTPNSLSCPFPHHSTYHHITYYIFIYLCGRLYSPRWPQQDFTFHILFLQCDVSLWEMFPIPLESKWACNCGGSDAMWHLRLGHKKPDNFCLVLLGH